jgi:hypothetical protein
MFGQMFPESGDQPTRESLSQIPFADRRQAIIGLDVDPLGRIWVLASTEDPGMNRLGIFDWEGNYLGNLGHRPIPDTFLRNGAPVYAFRDEDQLLLYAVLEVR